MLTIEEIEALEPEKTEEVQTALATAYDYARRSTKKGLPPDRWSASTVNDRRLAIALRYFFENEKFLTAINEAYKQASQEFLQDMRRRSEDLEPHRDPKYDRKKP